MDAEDIVARIIDLVNPVIEFFETADGSIINGFRSRGSSLASVNQNCLQMMSIIYEKVPTFDLPEVKAYMDSRDVQGTKQAKDMIDEINRILFEDVIARLKEHYGSSETQWWISGIPKAVRNSCDQMYNESSGERERWRYLFLSNYPEIVLHGANWDLFKPHYNFYGKGKKGDLVRWIGRINKARTVTHHAEKGPLPKDEVDFVRRVHALVKTHIEQNVEVVPNKNYLSEALEGPVSAPAEAA